MPARTWSPAPPGASRRAAACAAARTPPPARPPRRCTQSSARPGACRRAFRGRRCRTRRQPTRRLCPRPYRRSARWPRRPQAPPAHGCLLPTPAPPSCAHGGGSWWTRQARRRAESLLTSYSWRRKERRHDGGSHATQSQADARGVCAHTRVLKRSRKSSGPRSLRRLRLLRLHLRLALSLLALQVVVDLLRRHPLKRVPSWRLLRHHRLVVSVCQF